jgi:Ca-activated chloride channel family protein
MFKTFAHPWLLLGLAALPVLAIAGAWAWRRRQRALILFGGRFIPASSWRPFAVSTGLTLLALGMAGPRWGRDWSQSAAPGRDLIVVLDQSWSMFAEAPTRTSRAKDALIDLANALQRRGGHRVGLVAFAGTADVLCPLTHDLDHFRDVVGNLDDETPPPDLGSGTRLGNGIVAGLEALGGRAERDLLLISDGDDPELNGEWRIGIERARAEGVAVHCLAIGDTAEHLIRAGGGWLTYQGKEVKTRLLIAPLHRISADTRGSLLNAGRRSAALGDFYDQLALRANDDSPDSLPVRQQRHGWFLLPAFLLLLFAAWRPS